MNGQRGFFLAPKIKERVARIEAEVRTIAERSREDVSTEEQRLDAQRRLETLRAALASQKTEEGK